MGGPIARTVAAVTSLGASEFFQEKPFQDVTSEDRPTAGGSSPLRFSPLTAGAVPALRYGTSTVTGAPVESDPEINPEADARLRREQEEEERKGKTGDMLRPRPQTGAEEQQSRQRAIAASEVLGGSRKRRASQTLTTSQTALAGIALGGP